jgi:hypothetical protein
MWSVQTGSRRLSTFNCQLFNFNMSEPIETTGPGMLHCLAGSEAPAGIVDDLHRLAGLPDSARRHFWEALGPCLGEVLAPEMEARLDQFCLAHGAAGRDVARAIKACRFLLRSAACTDLSRDLFAQDLTRLEADPPVLGPILLPGYDTAKARIRAEILRETLGDHGKLLEGIDWRLDSLAASSRGDKLRAPIATLTFRYQEGGRKDRITLHVLPETLQELKRICDRLLG